MSEINSSVKLDDGINNLRYRKNWYGSSRPGDNKMVPKVGSFEKKNTDDVKKVYNTDDAKNMAVEVIDTFTEMFDRNEDRVIPELDKNLDQVAFEIVQGKYSNGQEMEQMLKEAGYNYEDVQAKVGEITPIYKKALEVINGNYSIGEERKELLSKEGYDYNTVQSMVNKILGIEVGTEELDVETNSVGVEQAPEVGTEELDVEIGLAANQVNEIIQEKLEQNKWEKQNSVLNGQNVTQITDEIHEEIEENIEQESVQINEDDSQIINNVGEVTEVIDDEQQSSLASILGERTGDYYSGSYEVVSVDGKEFVIFKQTSDEFGGVYYPGENSSVASFGCAPTSVSIIASGYGIETTVSDIVADGDGHSWDWQIVRDLEALGLTCEMGSYDPIQRDTQVKFIIDNLNNGNQIVQRTNMSDGYTAHWITFLDYNPDSNQVFVADPYENSGWKDLDYVTSLMLGTSIAISGKK